ncbi:unnamed protein product [Caenorhabditis angaria]|uniref:F-box domain-containing protein n=1 Tax=Caenorhabditis angaria TaxID=860376 RepID=A0A9P1N9V1_9PELO|nr:unnamed protein product [Caenorhabditis angaria]
MPISIKDYAHPSHSLPRECFGVVFKHLERKDVQKLRKTCSFMDQCYKTERNDIPGPICNAKFNYFDEQLTLTFSSQNSKLVPRDVPLSEWRIVFRNAECVHLEINTDSEIPMNLLEEILCCDLIEDIKYVGPQISEQMLNRLNEAAKYEIDLKVDNWAANTAAISKLTKLNILNPIASLEDIIEVMRTVPDINVCMSWETLVNSMRSLETLRNSKIVPDWQFNIHEVVGGGAIRMVEEQLTQLVQTILGEDVHSNITTADSFITVTVQSD